VIASLVIQIERFVADDQPGVVECSLIDAFGSRHIFVEKIPVVTAEDIWSDSSYPRTGGVRCQIERELTDRTGQALVQVDTELPDHVESAAGETCFVVRVDQVVRDGGCW
jgi:hypothetical protein